MNVDKLDKKWVISGVDKGWILNTSFPSKWKAKLALSVFVQGGGLQDYRAAAREEAAKRDERRRSLMSEKIEDARRAGGVILPDEPITVCRQPGDHRLITVPFSSLADFQIREVSGGAMIPTPGPFLFARMWCTDIPIGMDFPHSCLHGPAPHEIFVCITQRHNKKDLFKKLLSLVP